MRVSWTIALITIALIATAACANDEDSSPTPTATTVPTEVPLTPTPTAEPPVGEVMRGVFETGFEHAGFYPDAECPTEDNPYWVAWTSESNFAEQLEQRTGVAPFAGSDTLVFRITVRGELSPPGGYGHLSQYPRELTVSDLIEAEFTEDCDDDPPFTFAEPPPVFATTSSGDEVELGIGSYCWTAGRGQPGICADSIGIITNVGPLTVTSGATIFLSSQLVLADAEVGLQAWPVDGREPIASDTDWLAWSPEDSPTDLQVQVGDVGVASEADLPPGLYALSLFVIVPQGDVSYGLLLRIDGTGSGGNELSLGQPMKLTVGQTVAIEGTGDTLRFAGVVTDSRCPTDVQCVWAGEALLAFELTHEGASIARSVLAGSSGALAPYRLTVQELAPEPKSTRQIPPEDYVATIVLDRLPPLPSGSGIEGVVTLGPICPVQREDQPCPDRVHSATLILVDANGVEVDRVTSGEDGYYRLSVAPGSYTLMPQSPPGVPLPFAGPIEVTVTLDSWSVVEVPYDSGIR